MEYTAEIWFGNITMKIRLDSNNRDYLETLEVAEKIADKLGGEVFSITAQED